MSSSCTNLRGESSTSRDQTAGPKYFVSNEDGDSELRLDIQCLGFSSWDQKFDPERILLLYDEESLLPNPHFFFFHVEGMASLIGIGVPHSKVTLVCDHDSQHVVHIEEMREESWKKLWTPSCGRPLKPLVFGRSKNSSVSMDRKDGQGFVSYRGSVQPRWIGWFQELVRYVRQRHTGEDSDGTGENSNMTGVDSDGLSADSDCAGVEFNGSGEDSEGTEEDPDATDNYHGKSQALVQKGNLCREPGSMVVYVHFNEDNCLYKFDHTTNKSQRVENASTGDSKSSIQGVLTVKFSYDPNEAAYSSPLLPGQVRTRLRAQYQIEKEKHGHPLGWSHDNFGLSFQHGKSNDFEFRPPCFWQSKEFLSPLEYVDYEHITKHEVVKQTSRSESSVRDTENCGCLRFLAAIGLSLSLAIKNWEEHTTTRRESHQSVIKLQHRCLQQHPTLAICSNSTHTKLCWRAHSLIQPVAPEDTLEWRKYKEAGLYSNVDMEMEGEWIPLREGLETYKFVAEKKLSKYRKPKSANDDAPTESSDNTSAYRVDETEGEVDGREGVLWQKLKRKVLINHDFSEYFESSGERDAYTWVTPDS